ncbi:hypothetical protein [Sphingobacterium sp. LRF_L2]|uniref:hypothetical protein n=1 Tax=Sphingobacterium sp. LRF_L2 TaxID=3369421 RepID=UPI003F5F2F04
MDNNKVIKIGFKEANTHIHSDLEIYDSTNRIPFSLKIDYPVNRPTSIYCEISEGENFIELWFDKGTKKLYEITIVSIQEDTVQLRGYDYNIEGKYYECFIENDCGLEISKPVQTLRSEKTLSFSWGELPSEKYLIAKNCILGTDANKNLCSIILVNLSSEVIYQILGF